MPGQDLKLPRQSSTLKVALLKGILKVSELIKSIGSSLPIGPRKYLPGAPSTGMAIRSRSTYGKCKKLLYRHRLGFEWNSENEEHQEQAKKKIPRGRHLGSPFKQETRGGAAELTRIRVLRSPSTRKPGKAEEFENGGANSSSVRAKQ